jgi:hypothetical protein
VLCRLAVALALLAVAGPLGCGGGNGGGGDSSEHKPVAVIEGWVTALSKGDAEAASTYFAVPSLAENGTAPVTLRSHADVVAFNSSLPCGAELVRARPLGRFIAATFRLTERPGGACGPGSGQLAATAQPTAARERWQRADRLNRLAFSRLGGRISETGYATFVARQVFRIGAGPATWSLI